MLPFQQTGKKGLEPLTLDLETNILPLKLHACDSILKLSAAGIEPAISRLDKPVFYH